MGHYLKGILGAFRGKVGTVIGSRWRGTTVMKSLNTPSTKPPTLKQLTQQVKFALVTDFMAHMSDLVALGYKNHTSGATPMNAAVKYNLENAVTGTYPNFKMDYAKLQLTDERLQKLNIFYNYELATAPMHRIQVTWENVDRLNTYSMPTDKVMLVMFSELHGEFIGSGVEAIRSAGTMTVSSPRMYSDGPMHLWAFFLSADETYVSKTAYLGSITTTTS